MVNIEHVAYIGGGVAILPFVLGWWIQRQVRVRALRKMEELIHQKEVSWEQERGDWDKRLMESREAMEVQSRLIERREAALKNSEVALELQQRQVELREKELAAEEEQLERLIQTYRRRLRQLTDTTPEEALALFRAEIRKEHEEDLNRYRRELFDTDISRIEEQGQRALLDVIQRLNTDSTPVSLYTVVPLPSESYKGMVIGKEGRNSRVFENETGMTMLVDDDEKSVTLSGFDVIKRETARLALLDLIRIGKITPALIEEAVANAREQMDKNIIEEGEKSLAQLEIKPLGAEVTRTLGRLKYRLSNGQNTLTHSIEVSQICGMLAGEIGLDPQLARRAGLYHDLGKAIGSDHAVSHAKAGALLLKRYGEDPVVVNAVEAHHNEVEETSLYAPIVQIADRLSASRQGARRKSMSGLVERLGSLEGLAKSVNGVRDAHAFQAGRELRVMVRSDEVDDWGVRKIAEQIRHKLEEQLQIRDPIKITVIREVRVSETAR